MTYQKQLTNAMSLQVKCNIICIRMFHACRYRLEKCSGKRGRGRYTIQFCFWHWSTTVKPQSFKSCMLSNKSSRVVYIPLACCNHFSFPLRFCYFELDCCLWPQVHKHVHGIVAPKANLATILRCHLSTREKYKILGPWRSIFDPRAFGFVVSHEFKFTGDENIFGFGTQTDF